MIRPFIETNTCVDEFADGHTVGVFIGTWCLAGVEYVKWHRGGWRFGVILLNVIAGVWNEVF